jgi:hypothetical protein
MSRNLKSRSQTELAEMARAVGEMGSVSAEEIRQILRRTGGPVSATITEMVNRVSPEHVVLFVADRELGVALQVPTTRVATESELTQITGMSRFELEGFRFKFEADGRVKFFDTTVCLRNRDVHQKVISEKARIAMEPFSGKLVEDSIASRLRGSEPKEERSVTVGGPIKE